MLVGMHGPVNLSSQKEYQGRKRASLMSHLLSSILGASSSLSWSSSSNCPSKASKDGMTSSDMLGLSLTYYANVLANSASAERCLFPSSSARVLLTYSGLQGCAETTRELYLDGMCRMR